MITACITVWGPSSAAVKSTWPQGALCKAREGVDGGGGLWGWLASQRERCPGVHRLMVRRHQSLFGPASHASMWRSAVPKCRQRICVYLLPLLDCPREILHTTTDLHSVGSALSMSPDSACSVHPKTMQALDTHLPSVWCHCRGHCRRGASHKGPESSARAASTSAPSWKTRARGSRTLDGYAHSAAVPAAPHVCTASLHFWQASCTEHCWQSSNEHIALECFITSLSWHHDRRTFS